MSTALEMWEWCALVRGWIGAINNRTGAAPDEPIHPQPQADLVIKHAYTAAPTPTTDMLGDRPTPPPRDGAYHACCRLFGHDIRPATRVT